MIEDRAIAAIARAKDIPAQEISIDSTFEQLGVDSLDAIEILFELEEEFDISIPDEEAKGFASVSEVVDALRRYLAAPPEQSSTAGS